MQTKIIYTGQMNPPNYENVVVQIDYSKTDKDWTTGEDVEVLDKSEKTGIGILQSLLDAEQKAKVADDTKHDNVIADLQAKIDAIKAAMGVE